MNWCQTKYSTHGLHGVTCIQYTTKLFYCQPARSCLQTAMITDVAITMSACLPVCLSSESLEKRQITPKCPLKQNNQKQKPKEPIAIQQTQPPPPANRCRHMHSKYCHHINKRVQYGNPHIWSHTPTPQTRYISGTLPRLKPKIHMIYTPLPKTNTTLVGLHFYLDVDVGVRAQRGSVGCPGSRRS